MIIMVLYAFQFVGVRETSDLQNRELKVDESAGLGELGAECGGRLRLPCKPGLQCEYKNKILKTGVCAGVDNPNIRIQPKVK